MFEKLYNFMNMMLWRSYLIEYIIALATRILDHNTEIKYNRREIFFF